MNMDYFLRVLEAKGIDVENHDHPIPQSKDKVGMEFQDHEYSSFVTCVCSIIEKETSNSEFPSKNLILDKVREISEMHYKSKARPSNIKAIINILHKHWDVIKADIKAYSSENKHFVAPGRRLIMEYINNIAKVIVSNPYLALDFIDHLYENKDLKERALRFLRGVVYREGFSEPKNVNELNRRLTQKEEIVLEINRLVLESRDRVIDNHVYDNLACGQEPPCKVLIKADALATALVIDSQLSILSHKADQRVALEILKFDKRCREILELYRKGKSVISARDDFMKIIDDAQISVSPKVLKQTQILVVDYLICMNPKSVINIKRSISFKLELGHGLKIEAMQLIGANTRLLESIGYVQAMTKDLLKGPNKIEPFSMIWINDVSHCIYLGVGSFANHSCTPNAKYVLEGKKIYLETTKSIKKGSEITVSYADTFFGRGNESCLCKLCKNRRKLASIEESADETADQEHVSAKNGGLN